MAGSDEQKSGKALVNILPNIAWQNLKPDLHVIIWGQEKIDFIYNKTLMYLFEYKPMFIIFTKTVIYEMLSIGLLCKKIKSITLNDGIFILKISFAVENTNNITMYEFLINDWFMNVELISAFLRNWCNMSQISGIKQIVKFAFKRKRQ